MLGFNIHSTTAVLVLLLATAKPSVAAIEPLLRSQNLLDDSIPVKVPGGTEMLAHGGKCRAAFQMDGNLSINKRRGEPPYNPIGAFPTMWNTGVIGSGQYEYAMKLEGNFRIFELQDGVRQRTTFSTHSQRHADDGPTFLGIDDECILGIYKGTPENVGEKIWTNMHTDPLMPGDRLSRGVMYRDTKRNAFMILQPADGNLVVYDGSDFTDSDRTPLWASNTAGDASFDFHLDIRPNGLLKLTENGPPQKVYYTKDLLGLEDRFATACFHVALDPCTYEPTAISRPCPEDVEEVMRDGDTITSGTAMSFHDGKCSIRLQTDGNFNVYSGPYFMWHTGWAVPSATSDYILALRPTGRLLIKHGRIEQGGTGEIRWDSNSAGEIGDYFLGIDSSCVLHIFEGSGPEEAGEIVWSNILTRLSSGDRLERSEIFYDEESNQSMLLQHPDGNLVVYEGFPGEIDYGKSPKWAATANGANTEDFFLKVSTGKKIKLVDEGEGPFYRTIYYVKTFDDIGCFDIILDPITGEPLQS